MLKIVTVTALCAAAVMLTGCAHVLEELTRDRRDAPWDPRPGQGQLHDQIPNWDNEAIRRCGGHLPEGEAERRGMSRRC